MGKKSITTFFLLSEEELKQYQKSQEIESVVVKSTVSSKHSTAATISGMPKTRRNYYCVSSKHSTAATISPVESKVKREEVKFGKFTWIVLGKH